LENGQEVSSERRGYRAAVRLEDGKLKPIDVKIVSYLIGVCAAIARSVGMKDGKLRPFDVKTVSYLVGVCTVIAPSVGIHRL
jgi:hypothetical protein